MTTTKLLDIIARAEREGWTELSLGRNDIGDAGAAAEAERAAQNRRDDWSDYGGAANWIDRG